jgi:gamma-glutamylcyclotransferase (GGCT)/AIG2-like uncharacterized protein YtfP
MAQPADHDDPGASGAPNATGEPIPGAGPEPALERQLVFVYGTLKRGEVNHHWLEGASWLGESKLLGVLLHDLGPFPMAVIGDGTAIGEVYAVDEPGLARLDELEGYPRLYDRQVLSLNDGRQAWVYLGRPRQVRHAPLLAGGIWNPTKT